MPATNVNIRMDEELKRSMEDICHELGMNMTTAITIFARKMSRERRIPFDVSIDSFYCRSNMEALSRSAAEVKTGNVVLKSMAELEAMASV